MPEPLTPPQRAALLTVLSHFADRIERVDIYGSRAQGLFRPGSDVDLMLAGPIDWGLLARIKGALDESYLSIFADVAAYALLEAGEFRDQVIATAKPLFERAELLAARDAASRAA
ncbi:nucleotidyltransferase domain-containing protein [Sphingomonas sp.]|jgi:predicted nucleotidyltransferase|uniref:nucleotidyltransferase family protein n=1 Tax=Sphingomonas sp. TaxID=28214 RepID=UPI002EDB6084